MVAFFICKVFPLVTVPVFLTGMLLSIRRWLRGARPKLTLFPSAGSTIGMWRNIIKEVLVFESLFRSNRNLWGGTWVFHAGLLLILAGHARIVTDFPRLWNSLGMSLSNVEALEYLVGGGAGIIVLAMGLYLMGRRVLVRSVSEISTREDYLVLALLLAIILSGDSLRLLTRFDLDQSRAFFRGIILFQSGPVPSHPLFLVHFFLAQLLLIIMPFSKFMHIPGIFFTKPLLLRK